MKMKNKKYKTVYLTTVTLTVKKLLSYNALEIHSFFNLIPFYYHFLKYILYVVQFLIWYISFLSTITTFSSFLNKYN